MLTLSALNGQDKGRVFQLTGEQPELMGRQAPNIKLTDAQTSRRHAEIFLQNNAWLIRDLGSTNGTWVNGQKIVQITELEVGDRLVVGRHQFRVSAIENLPAPTPQPKPAQPEPTLGHEDLAAIGAGVDLSESLSADLLDDDGQEVAGPHEEEASGGSGIRTTPPADQPATKAYTGDDDALIDLDALLGEDKPGQPDDSADAQALNLESTPSAAPIDPDVEDKIDPPLRRDNPQASDTGDGFDLDALLGLNDDDQPDGAYAEPQDAPPAGSASDAVPTHTDDTPDPRDTPDVSDVSDFLDDDVLDLDAVLGGLVSDDDAEAAVIADIDDPIASARPLADDTHEDAQAPAKPEPTRPDGQEQDGQPATDDVEQDDTDNDSLIDIDILASAKPASDWRDAGEPPGDVPTGTELSSPDIETDAEPTAEKAPGEEPDDADEHTGDLGTGLDPVTDAFPVDGSDSGLGFDADADDEASSSHDTDASLDVEEADAEQADTDEDDDVLGASSAQVNEMEKGLLLSPREQAQAVTGYRRSKIKSLVGLLLLLGVLGAAVGYMFINYYDASHANATSTRTTGHPADQPDVRDTSPGTEYPTDNAQPPANNPGTQLTRTPEDQPTDPKPVSTPRRTPEQGQPGTPISYPDPFADIAPDFTQPQADETKPLTPAQDNDPAHAQPQPETPPQPEPATPPVPTPDITPDTPDTPDPVDDAPADEPAAQAPPGETPENDEQPAPGIRSALGIIKETQTTRVAPRQDDALTPKAELDLITGAIDAQNKPGDRVTGQAEYAGARKVVYLVDASGSLVDSFPFVLSEMNLAIDELTDDKAFTVIFFGSDGVTEVPPAGLKWADTRSKRRVREWVAPDNGNVNAWGRGDMIQALQHALAYRPDDLVILTDNLTGRQSTQETIDELLARIDALVAGKVQKVHVMQFFDRDPQQVLKTIAERFHGTYSLITNKPGTDAQSSADDPFDQP